MWEVLEDKEKEDQEGQGEREDPLEDQEQEDQEDNLEDREREVVREET